MTSWLSLYLCFFDLTFEQNVLVLYPLPLPSFSKYFLPVASMTLPFFPLCLSSHFSGSFGLFSSWFLTFKYCCMEILPSMFLLLIHNIEAKLIQNYETDASDFYLYLWFSPLYWGLYQLSIVTWQINPKLGSIKQQEILFSHSIWGSGTWEQLNWMLWLQVSQNITRNLLMGISVIWGLNGGWGSDSTMVHMAAVRGFMSLSCGTVLSVAWPSLKHGCWFPLVWVTQDRARREAMIHFMIQVLKRHIIISAIFCWSHKPMLLKCGRRLQKSMNIRRQKSLGAILGTGYLKFQISCICLIYLIGTLNTVSINKPIIFSLKLFTLYQNYHHYSSSDRLNLNEWQHHPPSYLSQKPGITFNMFFLSLYWCII